MKIVIEIPEEMRDNAIWYDVSDFDTEDIATILKAIVYGTPLPKTNGEVLMTMFPPSVYYGKDKRLVLLAKDVCLECVNDEWWNAEYKAESEDKE